ncbi:MAG: DNA recombination protein RmuC [Eubacteriales bacterium]|nr:DNA recombination protein RmuC [Eubacteriales bacterium]
MPEQFAVILLLVAVVVLLAVNMVLLIMRTGRDNSERIVNDVVNDVENLLDETEDKIIDKIGYDLERKFTRDADENRKNRTEITGLLERMGERQNNTLTRMQADQFSKLDEFREKTEETLKVKLDEINHGINKKLDVSLNERLDKSFKSVGDQLGRLYESLGELTKLEDGVQSLNRTLSNVKTRGVFGETQLENILANVLNQSQYDRNVVTKVSDGHNRDMVEFAVKIPDKETNAFMYLPIDSKFPATIYDKIQDASQRTDADALKAAIKELEQRIKAEAKDIRDKYIDPPNTTDFAIMFLPTESLYAEVLRIPGLPETLQKEYHVVITGPTTIAALLNSLSIGFRYMAVNKDSKNILKLLSAIKTQYGKLSELIRTTDNKIDSAKRATEELQKRTEMINRKLSAVEELDPIEAKSILGISINETVTDI